MMPYVGGKCKLLGHCQALVQFKYAESARLRRKLTPEGLCLKRPNSNNVVYFGQLLQLFKTTLDIGICAWAAPPCAVCLFFKPDYAKGS